MRRDQSATVLVKEHTVSPAIDAVRASRARSRARGTIGGRAFADHTAFGRVLGARASTRPLRGFVFFFRRVEQAGPAADRDGARDGDLLERRGELIALFDRGEPLAPPVP